MVAVAYFALGDTEQGQANVWDYYSISGDEIARLITNGVAAGPARVKDTVAAFADIGADELILNPTVGDLEEITRLADIVLGPAVRWAVSLMSSSRSVCCQHLRGDSASKPRARACATAWVRLRAPSFWYRCRWWVLTVFTDRYNSPAISGADRLVGR